ncbi:MAG: hypothetical protein EP343_34410 [Deltaproteobacteria bacterium]|nr:MAG: hypothetical protein EP343_34410 [Deltaproteobacteria bacterium]
MNPKRFTLQTQRWIILVFVLCGVGLAWSGCGPTTLPPTETTPDTLEQEGGAEKSGSTEESTGPENVADVTEPSPEEEPTPENDTLDASGPESNEETVEQRADSEPPPESEPAPEVLAKDNPPPQDAPNAIALTWWECHTQQNQLSLSEQDFCDKHHTQAPNTVTFKIRWIFLYNKSNPTNWIQPRLKILNERFRPANITFETHSITLLKNTVLAPNGEHDNTQSFKLKDLKNEMVALLKLPANTSAQAALDTLKQRLLDNGVTASSVNSMTLNTTLNNNGFLYRTSRVWEKEINIFVAKKLLASGGKTPGGYASLPAFAPHSVTRGSILLKEAYREDALAHEVGHYFGLVHTQATQETLNLASLNASACKTYLPNGVASMKTVLQKQLGSQYSQPLGKPFLSYKAATTTWKDYYALRCAIGRLYISWINTFQKPDVNAPTTWKNFATFGEFAQHVLDGKKAYEKLFSKTVNGKTSFNCKLGSTSKVVECTYGSKTYLGTDALLKDSIAFQSGKASNLMSYLNNATSFPIRLLAKEQATMLFYHIGSPDRLSLRNYAISP